MICPTCNGTGEVRDPDEPLPEGPTTPKPTKRGPYVGDGGYMIRPEDVPEGPTA